MSPSIPPMEPPAASPTNPLGSEAPPRPRIIVTAGPTHEPIDGVRYLANRSSGQMGIRVAEAAAASGAPTTLLLGPTHLRPEEGSSMTLKRFQTTAELEALLESEWPSQDILFMAAAVADYRLSAPELTSKHERTQDGLKLDLEATPDLLMSLARNSRPDQMRIGWALEPSTRLAERAREKLERKKLDVLVANPLETIAADSVEAVVLLAASGGPELVQTPSPSMLKGDFARWLLELIYRLRDTAPGIKTPH